MQCCEQSNYPGAQELTYAQGHYIVEAIAETGNLVAVDIMVSGFWRLTCAWVSSCQAMRYIRDLVGEILHRFR